MNSVSIDTNILIYLSQPFSPFYKDAIKLLEFADKTKHTLFISSFGIAEYLSFSGTFEQENDIMPLLDTGVIHEIPFGRKEAELFAQLRQNHNIGPIDAAHIATAITGGANFFVTNDRQLQKLELPNIKIIGPGALKS